MTLKELLKEAVPNPRWLKRNKDKLLIVVKDLHESSGLIGECTSEGIEWDYTSSQKYDAQVYQRIYPK